MKSKDAFIQFLVSFTTKARFEQLQQVLNQRTRYLTVVLEDIYQSQNASAVLRTCDCVGIQDVHIIENENDYQINPDVVRGASKWLTINRYDSSKNNTLSALQALKNQGYRIVATSPHANDTSLPDFDLSKGKAAIVFGTERTGISDIVREQADEFVKIPMVGFTESFNISVSAALVLYQLTQKLRLSDLAWQLPVPESADLLIEWLKLSIKKSELLEKRFLEEQ
jgi:tRNA (guanosine-2'-O-)-methyltransferase